MGEKVANYFNFNNFLIKAAKRNDVTLSAIFVTAIFMMIFTLPSSIIDFMIAVNLSVSVILLLIAINTNSAAEFSSFPTILLITTLYRLAITLSTSKLILLKHEAGEIIQAFGKVIVGGNIVVGIIIFSILTIIQFLVITKGSERVAEVSARFSLDAMPGKQMSIDGDMRAGTIDAEEAKRQRLLVQQESQLYGAMDGAMKFIKGDAIASIIVILVNILGGITIGVLQAGMSATTAATTYTILSIGDGLVSQIPSLIISITSGIIVTRVPGEANSKLADDLFKQIGNDEKPFYMASFLLLLFAFVPGFPYIVFILISASVFGLGYLIKISNKNEKISLSGKKNKIGIKGLGTFELTIGATPLSAKYPKHWNESKIKLTEELLYENVANRLGLAMPEIVIIEHDSDDPENIFTVFLYQDRICEFEIPNDKKLCLFNDDKAPEDSESAKIPYVGPNVCWVKKTFEMPEKSDMKFYNDEEILVYLFERVMLHLGREFLGIQEMRYLMDSMEIRYSELVKEVQRQVPLSRLTEVLQRLLEEGVSIKNLRNIFESLITWNNKEKDIVLLTEYVRISLKRNIICSLTDRRKGLMVWNVGEALENLIRGSIRQTTAGSYAALAPDVSMKILELIKEKIGISKRGILLTVVDVRRYLRKLLEIELFDVSVISRQELSEDTPVNILGNIDFIEDYSEKEEDSTND